MDVALQLITGLNERDRKLVVYWNLATHALPKLNTFPLLALRGKFGTGKSQTLHIIKSFAHQPRAFSLRSRTEAAIRDELADCYEGSAIVEEADQAWKDVTMAFERMLSDRYQRASAEAAHKVFAGEKQWETVTKKYFGATVLHRRLSFNDPALDGRTVLVQFRADNSRTYQEFCEDDPWIVQGSRLAQGLTFDMPTVNQPPDIAARVFNTYAPLLGIAKLCSDDDFVRQILQRLQQETLELKEAQAEEPDGLVLRAIVEAIFERGTSETPEFRYVKFRDIAESIFRNHKVTLQPRQIGPIARELGFETKTAHGVTVVVPTLATLLKACGMCDYTDEGIEQLRREILEGESKSAAARRAKLFS
jgi:hypothetical protein